MKDQIKPFESDANKCKQAVLQELCAILRHRLATQIESENNKDVKVA